MGDTCTTDAERGTENVKAPDQDTFVLKPNSALLDANFPGYKLSLDKIPIHSKENEKGVLQAPESSSSYSYQQVRLHALHNHLWQDPWCPLWSYYFNSDGELHRVGLDQTATPAAPLHSVAVLRLPAGQSQPACDPPAHPSLSLTSARLAVLSDGRGQLHVADTGERPATGDWQIEFSDTMLEGRGFVLLHSVLDSAAALHVLTSHVAEADGLIGWRRDGEGDATASFVNVLSWLMFVKGAAGWSLSRLRQAATSGTVHYACLEPPVAGGSGGAFCVAADGRVLFLQDTARPVQPLPERHRTPQATAAPVASPLYVWTQSEDEITVTLSASGDGDSGAAPRVALELEGLTVTSGDSTVLTGQLAAAIKLDESTWTCDGGRLEVTLAKAERGRIWPELLVGDTRGEQAADAEVAAQLTETLAQLTAQAQDAGLDKNGPYDSTEAEDCDDWPADSAALLRLDGETHAVTDQASLGSHQYILTARLAADQLPALCVRHDVDALLWQPRTRDDRWQCEHVGTLNAFGFVQASKQQRKFLTCSPDHSYAAVCDTSRHVYLYHQPAPVTGELRNRKTGQRVTELSRQQVVGLDHCEPILGVAAASSCLYLLTAGHVHALVIS